MTKNKIATKTTNKDQTYFHWRDRRPSLVTHTCKICSQETEWLVTVWCKSVLHRETLCPKQNKGLWDGSAGKRVCHQIFWPEFEPWLLHGSEREPTPLYSPSADFCTCAMAWACVWTCVCAHLHRHTHTYNINKCGREFKNKRNKQKTHETD